MAFLLQAYIGRMVGCSVDIRFQSVFLHKYNQILLADSSYATKSNAGYLAASDQPMGKILSVFLSCLKLLGIWRP